MLIIRLIRTTYNYRESTMNATRLIAIILLSLISACETVLDDLVSTQTTPPGFTTVKKIEKNLYMVSYNGNHPANFEQIKDLMILRSAEFSLYNNFDYFVVINSQAGTSDKQRNKDKAKSIKYPVIHTASLAFIMLRNQADDNSSFNANTLSRLIRKKYGWK